MDAEEGMPPVAERPEARMTLEPEYWIKCVCFGFTWLCHCTQDVEMC